MSRYIYMMNGVRFDLSVLGDVSGHDVSVAGRLHALIGELYDIEPVERPRTQAEFEQWLRDEAEKIRAMQIIEEGI